ncbi:MAG: Tim44 domain-containing protein [Burkholderiales bacterium]|nr:Tim44 domain-containing protein [Burkholderiales bacterium]
MIKAISAALIATAIALAANTVDAKKFGGGKSVGAQRSAPTQVQPSAPANASAATAAPAAAAAGATGAAAAAAKPSLMSRMAGPLAGIAAGIGLGYLFSKLGAGGFLGLLLIAAIGIGVLIWFARSAARRQQPATANGPASFDSQPSAPQPMQYAGSAAGGAAPVMAGGLSGGFGIPAGFDKAGFEDNAKKQFMKLQAANDKGDLDGVRDFVTDELYNEIAKDVVVGNKDATQVDELQAELLGIETERGNYWASVRFSGKMREDGMMMASPFQETWNLVKPVDGSKGWLVAGIQQG